VVHLCRFFQGISALPRQAALILEAGNFPAHEECFFALDGFRHYAVASMKDLHDAKIIF
jgi:hypothetical protein